MAWLFSIQPFTLISKHCESGDKKIRMRVVKDF